jgi:uncharacterized membrane protein
MDIELRDIDSIIPYEKNPRLNDDAVAACEWSRFSVPIQAIGTAPFWDAPLRLAHCHQRRSDESVPILAPPAPVGKSPRSEH